MLNKIVLNRTDYLHKMDLALNNLQGFICHKTQQNKPNLTPVLTYFFQNPLFKPFYIFSFSVIQIFFLLLCMDFVYTSPN